MSLSLQPISVLELKEKFKTFKSEADKGQDSPNLLNEFLELLRFVTEDPVSRIYCNNELKKFFFEEFVSGLTRRITSVKTINDDCLNIIGNIVMTLVELFVKEIERDNSDMADAMRCIFDQQQHLYQHYFQASETSTSTDDPNFITQLSEEERTWRLSLAEGSQIDAIKIDPEYGLKTWAKATIKTVEGEGSYFVVEFENDNIKMSRNLTRYSLDIARSNSMSEGDQWRSELNTGDLIDAFDSTKIWYASTIMDQQVREEDGISIPYIKIGFRIFHPDGNKVDDNSQRFFGWSDRFDEWLPAYNPRIQKFNTLAKNWEQQSSGQTQFDETVDDQMDMLIYAKNQSMPIYAVARKKCRSTLLVQFLNKFGELGGYQLLIEKINQRGEDSMGLDTLFYYLDCLSNCMIMLNKAFLNEYLPQLESAVKMKVLTATETQLRNVKKDRIDGIVNCLISSLFSRIKNYKQREHDKNLLNLEIGCMFLEQNFLERRIDGAKLITDVCRNSNLSTYQASSETVYNNANKQQQLAFLAEVVRMVKANNVLSQIFSKQRGHLQLVQRTEELLKLLISQNALNDEELELIWASTRIDEATKLELYKVLNELSSRLRSGEITFIIDQLDQQKLNLIIAEEVDLVSEMSKRVKSAETSYGDMAVQFMWKIAFENNNNVDKVLVNQAAIALTDIIKTWENEHKLKYIKKLVHNLQRNAEGFLSIKMLMRILKDFSASSIQSNQKYDNQDQNKEKDGQEQQQQQNMEVDQESERFSSKSYFIEYIFKKYHILDAFFSNFKQYAVKAEETIQRKLKEEPNLEVNTLADKCLADKFIHSEQLSERLEFIKYIGCNSSVQINKEQLSFVWEELVLNSQLQNDQEMFYMWLRDVCDIHSTYNCIIELDDLIQFFREKMSAKTKAFLSLTIEGFNCIQSFFILLNETSRLLQRLNVPVPQNNQNSKFTSYNNKTGEAYNQFTFNQNKNNTNGNSANNNNNNFSSQANPEDIEIQVMAHPHSLEGIEGIWQIATDSNDQKVSERAVSLLLKLYTCVAYHLENNMPEFENSYIKTCIDGIEQQMQIISSRTEEQKEEIVRVEKQMSAYSYSSVQQKILPFEERKILKFMTLLKELIKNSERDGTHGLKPHSALFKGEYLHTLQISNSLKSGNKYQNKVEIGCYSNITLWELRKLIGERVSRIYNQDGSYTQEAPCHPSTVRIYRYTGSLDLKESDNGKTLAELRFKPNESLSVFRKNTFCVNKVPLMNEDGSDMNKIAKDIFIEWFNQYSIIDPENPSRRVMTPKTLVDFTKSCTDDNCTEDDSRIVGFFTMYDHDNDLKIVLEDFLVFYLNSCKEKEDVVRQNLCAHGYRFDLKKNAQDGEEDNIMQARKTKFDMPRYKIANDHRYFNVIFQLLDLQGEVSNQAWNVIKMISTNPNLYDKVLLLEKGQDFQWSDIFETSSIYRILYSLQIIESLLEEDQSLNQLMSVEDELKSDWIQRFLSVGGFQEILKLFHTSLDLLSHKPVDSLSKFEKNFLEFMLKMIRIFMMAAFCSTQEGFQDVLALVRKDSSYQEQQLEGPKELDKNQDSKFNYKTPQKQTRGKFVDNIRKEINQNYQPDVTEDFLFGGKENQQQQQEKHTEKETKTEEKDDNRQVTQEDTARQQEESERFSELAAIMRNSGLGELILNQIDFKELQEQVLEVICLILSKKEIVIEDKQIVENALGLWIASLLKNSSLINDFYNFTRSDQKAGMFGIKNAEQFIIAGIYCYKNIRVRDEFCNTIIAICLKIHNPEGVQPLQYVLDILRKNFPKEDQYYATRECKQFFDLFIKLIEQYFLVIESGQIEYRIDEPDLLRETIEKLKRHETKEKKSITLEDMTLIGYMTLVEKLIVYLTKKDKASLLRILEETDLLHDIYYECLFYHPDKTRGKNENKCKTKESRLAAFNLLGKHLEALEPKEFADFLEQYLWPMIKDLPRPKKWNHVASENSKVYQFLGINNLGCICYMISMLQQFYMVPAFRYQLLKAIDKSPIDIKEYKGLQVDDSLLRQLQKMYGYLESSERHSYDPTEFCFAFKDFDGLPTNTSLQQDAQEFLNIFFDRIEELLKPTSQKYLLEGVFGGKNCSQLICQSCGNVRNILESFYNLSVPVKDRKGLEESLQKMIEGSLINDYFCENCDKKVDVFKRSLIAETPNVLIVHLQRIIFNFDTFLNDKVNSRFEFPNILNLKEYSFKSVMEQEERPREQLEAEEVKHLLDIQDDEYIYKLVGVNIHVGTADHGHYYSLINTKRGQEEHDENKPEWMQTEKDSWKVFDDDKIKPYSFNELKVDSFGGSSSSNMSDNEMNVYLAHSGAQSYGKNAYMLVYERKKKKNLKEVIVDEGPSEVQSTDIEMASEVSATLECADSATSRAAEENQASSVNNGINMMIANNQQQQQLPLIQDINYRKVQNYMPSWIQQIVHDGNITFLMDKHIYHEQFFNFLKQIFKHVGTNVLYTQYQYKYDYIPNFVRLKKLALELVRKSMFDLLSYYYFNTQMSEIYNSFSSLIQFCDSFYSLERGEESLLLDFLQKAYLNDNCQQFFYLMFNCPDKTSRYYIGKMTSALINKIFQIYHDCQNKDAPRVKELLEGAERLIYVCIKTLATQDCQKNWTRLENFLKMIQEIGNGGPYQAHFMLTKFDIVTDLIDFMLGNKSPFAIQKGEKRPNMGAGQSNPPFEPLVALVCYLIRFSLTPEMKNEQYSWNVTTNLPPSTLQGFYQQSDIEQEEKYPLSQNAFNFFTTTDFIDKVLKEGYECEELGKALAHFCYKNEKFTKQVCKLLLKGISRNDYEKVKNYLDVVTQVALIRDEMQRIRLEWIFGFGVLNSQTSYMSKDQENQSQMKLGIQMLNSLNDEVVSYKSALIYDSNDDALLHLLWRYKGRMDTYTVSCLYSLVNLLAADDNIAEYFSELPGPTYCLARYTDWIKPYLYEQLIDAKKGYSGNLSSTKEEVVVKTLSLFEKYEIYLALKDNNGQEPQQQQQQNEIVNIQIPTSTQNYGQDTEEKMEIDSQGQDENVRNLINENNNEKEKPAKVNEEPQLMNVIPCEPQPYIIVECLGETDIAQEDYDGVQFVTSEVACLYTMSRPTGNNNLSVPEKLYKKSYNTYGTNKVYKPQKNFEQEMQSQCIKNYFQSSNFKGNDKKNGDTNGDQQESYPLRVVEDEGKQWDHLKMNVSDIENEDDEERGYVQDQEGKQEEEPQQQEKQQQEEPQQYASDNPNNVYKLQVIEEGQPQNDDQKMEEDREENVQQQQQEKLQNIDEEAEDEPTNLQWPQDVVSCKDLAYKFQVYNSRNNPIKINLKFTQTDPHSNINLQWPRGGVKAVIYSKQTKTLLLIPKIRPDKVIEGELSEIDKLSVNFIWQEKVSQNSRTQIYPSQSSINHITTSQDYKKQDNQSTSQLPVVQETVAEDGTTDDKKQDAAVGDDFIVPAPSGQKMCPQCTVFNDDESTMCYLCDFIFP